MPQVLAARWPDTPPADTVDVLFFGSLGDVFGRRRRVGLPRQGARLSAIRSRVAELTPGGDAILKAGVRYAVDQEMTGDDVWVRPGQEVAFFSTFSGG